MITKEYYSTKELSIVTGVSEQTIRNNTYKIHKHTNARVKAGGRVLYRIFDIEKALTEGKLF